MTGKLSLGLLATWVVAGVADTAVSLYGQCGGEGYAGATNCVSGAYCTSYNAWYYQCVPGTAAATATSAASTPVSVSATTTATSGASSAPAASVKYFISFGDSYSQTGFNVSLTKPAAGNPLGNPPLPGWTASGGLNWVGFLVSQFNAGTLLSYNFAYGGATTNASLVTPFQSTVLSFIDQVSEFSNSIGVTPRPSYAPWTADNTLVGVWMGVNDVGNAWYNSDVPTLLGKIMDSYFGQLQILYKAGARNFVLLSVPPTYETPYMEGSLTTAQLGTLNTTIAEYNTLIATRLAAFTQANSGVNAKIVDTTVPFNTAINNPTAYGAPNATCYNSDGTSCLWFNDYHPGIAINKLVAQAVAASWKGSFFK